MRGFGVFLIWLGAFVVLAGIVLFGFMGVFAGLVLVALGFVLQALDNRNTAVSEKPKRAKGWVGMKPKKPHSEFDMGGKHLGESLGKRNDDPYAGG